jgi:hypothetical protein
MSVYISLCVDVPFGVTTAMQCPVVHPMHPGRQERTTGATAARHGAQETNNSVCTRVQACGRHHKRCHTSALECMPKSSEFLCAYSCMATYVFLVAQACEWQHLERRHRYYATRWVMTRAATAVPFSRCSRGRDGKEVALAVAEAVATAAGRRTYHAGRGTQNVGSTTSDVGSRS